MRGLLLCSWKHVVILTIMRAALGFGKHPHIKIRRAIDLVWFLLLIDSVRFGLLIDPVRFWLVAVTVVASTLFYPQLTALWQTSSYLSEETGRVENLRNSQHSLIKGYVSWVYCSDDVENLVLVKIHSLAIRAEAHKYLWFTVEPLNTMYTHSHCGKKPDVSWC